MIKWFFIWVFCFCKSKHTIYKRFKSLLKILKYRFLCPLLLVICTVYWNCCRNWYFRNLWKHGSPFEWNHDREGPSTFWRNLASEFLHFSRLEVDGSIILRPYKRNYNGSLSEHNYHGSQTFQNSRFLKPSKFSSCND